MSDAIEVLKKCQSDIDQGILGACSDYELDELHGAISQTIVALEKQDKLVEWLEKEIEHEEEIINDFDLHGVCANRHVLAKLKEVLKKVGE
jgi:hypothetical protein